MRSVALFVEDLVTRPTKGRTNRLATSVSDTWPRRFRKLALPRHG